jgi:hypothetical protein
MGIESPAPGRNACAQTNPSVETAELRRRLAGRSAAPKKAVVDEQM